MRKMVSSKQAKVLNNLVVNNDGTIVEIGGNVAVESIEQLGTLADKSGLEFGNFAPGAAMGGTLVASGCTGIEEVPGSSWLDATNVTPVTGICNNDGEVGYMGGFGYMVYKQNGVKKYSAKATSAEFNGKPILKSASGTIVTQEGITVKEATGKEFKPFFTEEQYQAILNLIA